MNAMKGARKNVERAHDGEEGGEVLHGEGNSKVNLKGESGTGTEHGTCSKSETLLSRVVYGRGRVEVLEEPWVVEGGAVNPEEEVETEAMATEGLDSCVVDLSEDFNRIFRVNTFNNFQEFEKLFTKFKEETGSVFRVKSSCSVAYENSRRKKHFIPERFKFVSIKYCCVHYGQPKVSGQGIRNKQRYLPCGCGCVLSLAYNRGALFISQVVMQHNHEVNSDMAPYYAINRRITNSELKQVAHVIDLMPSSRALQQFLQEHFHKPTTLQDAKNIRARLKMLQMQPKIKDHEKSVSPTKCDKQLEPEGKNHTNLETSEEEQLEREREFTELEVVADDLQDYKHYHQQHLDHNDEEENFQQPKWKAKAINEVKTKLSDLMSSWDTSIFWERLSVINKLIECWENGDNFDICYNPEISYHQNQGIIIKKEPESSYSGSMESKPRKFKLKEKRENSVRKISPSSDEPTHNVLPVFSDGNMQLPTSLTQSNLKTVSSRSTNDVDTVQKKRPGRPRKHPVNQNTCSANINGLEVNSKRHITKTSHDMQPIVLSVTRDKTETSDQAMEVEIEVNGDVVQVKRVKQEPLDYFEVDTSEFPQYHYGEHSYV